MPKTTTFKYVSGKSSGSNFSPTSVGTTSHSPTPSPATTTYSSTAQTERIERRHVNYNSDRNNMWMDATDSQPHEAFFYVELLCNIWFIVEFTIRFLVIIILFYTRIFELRLTLYISVKCTLYIFHCAHVKFSHKKGVLNSTCPKQKNLFVRYQYICAKMNVIYEVFLVEKIQMCSGSKITY